MTDVRGPAFNMADFCIGASARATPEKDALLVFDNPASRQPCEQFTFALLEVSVLKLAAGLAALGLKPGDRVAIHLGNSSHSALLFFAAIAGGFVALPLSDTLTPRELQFLLHDSGASLIATSQNLDAAMLPSHLRIIGATDIARFLSETAARPYAETYAEDPAFLIYTSGTTARPKGVLHAHRSALGRKPMYQDWYGLSASDRMLHAGAFNWTYTLGVGLTDPWANGATAIVYTGEKKPEHWPRLIAQTGATLFAAVPGVYRQILKYANPSRQDFGALRHGLVAGETPPPGLFEAWHTATSRPLYEALGMSEISTYISTGPSTPHKSGAIGKPQAGRRVAILAPGNGTDPLAAGEEGLIAVHRSDPGLMLGYWNRPEEEAQVYRGAWFVGGDLGKMDDEGYVTHLGRANELMNAGGYRVSPLEVEAVLVQAPGIAEAACAELATPDGARIIGAFLVSAPGQHAAAADVLAFAAARLAPYKLPREIVFVKALPRTANGKVKRADLVKSKPRI